MVLAMLLVELMTLKSALKPGCDDDFAGTSLRPNVALSKGSHEVFLKTIGH